MTISSQEAGGAERFGAFPFRGINDGLPDLEHVGLIGLHLPDVWVDRMAAESGEPTLWQTWLSRCTDGESVRFGDRIGPHLWFYTDIPEVWRHAAQTYLDSMARRIRDLMLAEAEMPFLPFPASSYRGDTGFAAAIVSPSPNRSFKDTLYEAFLSAASRLQGWGFAATETESGAEMERILREGDIRSVYQPLLELKTGSVFGYEALTRCAPDGFFNGPLALFRCAEREGYAFALDRLAREKAIRSCPPLRTQQKIFINVNSGIMKDPHFVSGQTRQWLAARGLGPGQVVLELTERSSIDDFEEAKRMLEHYRSQGYEIAIDDAGAGYSSLQAIVELRPDYIKLDKSLVQNADRDEMKKHMLRTFVRFAKRMRIRTVAEGIERPEELHLVRAMGIHYGQGYLIGRPSERPVELDAAALMKR